MLNAERFSAHFLIVQDDFSFPFSFVLFVFSLFLMPEAEAALHATVVVQRGCRI
jgi:hypothetical protein